MGEFAHISYGILAQVITQSHIDFIRAVDELLDGFLGRDAQFTRITGQLIELLTGCSGIHLLEGLVHLLDLFLGLSGVFLHIDHLLVHGSIVSHALAYGE